MKTVISLELSLLERIDGLAQELGLSRSRLLALAAEDFLRKHENAQMIAQIELACADGPSAEEREMAQAMQTRHRQLLERER